MGVGGGDGDEGQEAVLVDDVQRVEAEGLPLMSVSDSPTAHVHRPVYPLLHRNDPELIFSRFDSADTVHKWGYLSDSDPPVGLLC